MNDAKTDSIREEHERLKRIHRETMQDQMWWEEILNDRRMKTVLDSLDTEVDTVKESLVSCDKKDIDSLQARIKANRALLSRIKANADQNKVAESRRALDAFESQNALFIQAQEEDDEEPESKTG